VRIEWGAGLEHPHVEQTDDQPDDREAIAEKRPDAGIDS
jgi:hypothetical protein